MIQTLTKPTTRPPKGMFTHLSQMDYTIVCRVLKLLPSAGIDDEEFSFLLGKRDQYFFDLIHPGKKEKLKTEFLDMLPTILHAPFRSIIPEEMGVKAMIKLYYCSKKIDQEEGMASYSHTIYDEQTGKGTKVIWQKPLQTGQRRRLNTDVHTEMLSLLDTGYFNEPQHPLAIYRKIAAALAKRHHPFSVRDVQKSLAVLTRNDPKKGIMAVLEKTEVDTMVHYKCFKSKLTA